MNDATRGGTDGSGRPGGPEWTLSAHGYEASITSVGATLRRLTFGDEDLVVPFSAEEMRPLFRGAIVAPWPNRIADGRYHYDGQEMQLPINEVDRHHALHGLVLWGLWKPQLVETARLSLAYELPAQQGYPFTLSMTVDYEIRPSGLTTTLSCTNLSLTAAPYGCCPHPYLRLPAGRLDDWTLTLPAATRLEVDHRLIPTHLAPAAAWGCDFRAGEVVGDRRIDHAFTDIEFDADGLATASLTAADGTGVRISWGRWAPWIQVHTADRPEPRHDRAGLALEPMSCPPDAFNAPSGPPLLPPGQTHVADWVIVAIPVPE